MFLTYTWTLLAKSACGQTHTQITSVLNADERSASTSRRAMLSEWSRVSFSALESPDENAVRVVASVFYVLYVTLGWLICRETQLVCTESYNPNIENKTTESERQERGQGCIPGGGET